MGQAFGEVGQVSKYRIKTIEKLKAVEGVQNIDGYLFYEETAFKIPLMEYLCGLEFEHNFKASRSCRCEFWDVREWMCEEIK